MSVEKFIVCKDAPAYTIIPNTVLQGLKNLEALGLYAYLISLPHGWSFYKTNICDHAKIGREKLNKLLKILAVHQLIKSVQIRGENGQFAHFELHVLDGTSFKNSDLQESVQPLTEKPLTVNREPVSDGYKYNNNKNNKNYKNNISCASVDARHIETSFNEFWELYPVKKNKKRSQQIWTRNRLYDKKDSILTLLKDQLSKDTQYQTTEFVPHPATYLLNERWTDQIAVTIAQPKVTAKQDAPRSAVNRMPEFVSQRNIKPKEKVNDKESYRLQGKG